MVSELFFSGPLLYFISEWAVRLVILAIFIARHPLRSAMTWLEAKPFLIKPNRYDLETLLGCSLDSTETVASEARKLRRRGVEYVCVSLDGEGALLVGPENSYHANTPDVLVLSSVGVGDSSMVAVW